LIKYNLPWSRIAKSSEDFKYIEWEYDKILVSAASINTIPKQLLKKLKIMWIMVIPVGDSIYKVTKLSKDKLDLKKFYWFQFVPLIYSEKE
jgi:protein-L-isoaspartate O-methyltransferase